MKNISILGSTGSIGTQTLEVVRELGDYNIVCMTANNNIDLFENQIREFKPKLAVVYDEAKAEILKSRINDTSTKVSYGMDGLVEAATKTENDLVVISIVGTIGLIPTLEAIKSKTDIALATKEVLVAAGEITMRTAKDYNTRIFPIDSEHCAISQCLSDNGKEKINKIILTASGGPFRGKTIDELKNVTPDQALKHPTWSMGAKITIDSATLMNKGLEVIEAKWLFDMEPDKIEVVVHPQSIIHSMVEYVDGVVIAQLGAPDMRVPIQYAITCGNRTCNNFEKLNLMGKSLTFEKPDIKTFKALKLAYDALNSGGTMSTVLSRANEIAVELFFNKKIGFTYIADLVEECMKRHTVKINPTLNDILSADLWARKTVEDIIKHDIV